MSPARLGVRAPAHAPGVDELEPLVTVQIVILAMVAAFLGLRLYSVLGRRAEHGDEQARHETVQSRFDAAQPGAPAAPAANGLNAPAAQPRGAAAATKAREPLAVLPTVERGLREIITADRRFDPHAFLEGARGAYGLVLAAFWRGDKEELAKLCDADVLAGFAAEIDERVAAGEVVGNRLVRINEVMITAAGYEAPHARIAVRFVADIAAVTRDGEGHVVAGSLDDAIEVRDVWTFRRNITSTDPDWLLDETDEG